jgi:hypothetical protein
MVEAGTQLAATTVVMDCAIMLWLLGCMQSRRGTD